MDGASFTGCVNFAALQPFLDRMAEAAKGFSGDFAISNIDVVGGKDQAPRTSHVPNGPGVVEALANAVTDRFGDVWDGSAINLYFGCYLTKPGLDEVHKGTADDVVGVFVAVGDLDAWNATKAPPDLVEWLKQHAHAVVETSPGSYQPVFFLDRPYPPNEAKPILVALTRSLGGDATQSVEHLFRLPHTLNHPNAKKIAAGRAPNAVWSKIVQDNLSKPGYTLEALRALILARWPQAFDEAPNASAADDKNFDWQRHEPGEKHELGARALTEALNREGDRSKAAFVVINRLRRRHYSPQEILDVLTANQGTVVMQHFVEHPGGFEKQLRLDIVRAFTKKNKSEPSGPAADAFRTQAEQMRWEQDHRDNAPPPKRTIELTKGFLPIANKAAGEALLEQRVGIYKNGSRIVMPIITPVEIRDGEKLMMVALTDTTEAMIREVLTAAATFRKWVASRQEFVEVNCPSEIARGFMEGHSHVLRPLMGIINAPTIRADGTILARPGYDEETGLLFEPRGIVFPSVPANPSREDALAALAELKSLVREYRFESGSDQAAWLSYALTCVCRRTLEMAPLHIFTAPVAGAGKGKLVDAGAIIATGNEAPAFSQGANAEELEKRLASALLLGHAIVNIDNCTAPVQGDFLNMLLTQRQASMRVLGLSKMVTLPAGATLAATGNNLTVLGDLTRRTIRCGVNPETEHPEARCFPFDPVAEARKQRPRLLVAALTVLRAHALAGYPEPDGHAPLGSFGSWDQRVRCALLWLGEADPYGNHEILIGDDEDRQELGNLTAAWHKVYGPMALTLKEAVAGLAGDTTTDKTALQDAMLAVAPDRARSNSIDVRKLGYYLRARKNRIVGSHRFVPLVAKTHSEGIKWKCL